MDVGNIKTIHCSADSLIQEENENEKLRDHSKRIFRGKYYERLWNASKRNLNLLRMLYLMMIRCDFFD